mmetsp:Transcript_10661/g.26752  ORF Transcript_10661/g.26752 Transcript_10661/m.26752 type:complete len:314 (+) Transcript_10661:660-1601(+)
MSGTKRRSRYLKKPLMRMGRSDTDQDKPFSLFFSRLPDMPPSVSDEQRSHVTRKYHEEIRMMKKEKMCKKLELVLGAVIRFIVNLSFGMGVVNGKHGTVVDFMTRTQWMMKKKGETLGADEDDWHPAEEEVKFPVIELADGRRLLCRRWKFTAPNTGYDDAVASCYMLPICLAFATTYHYVKGKEFNKLTIIDATSIFQKGMMYTGLSRPRLLDTNHLVITHLRGRSELEALLSRDDLAFQGALRFQQEIEEQYFNEFISRGGVQDEEAQGGNRDDEDSSEDEELDQDANQQDDEIDDLSSSSGGASGNESSS